MAAGSASPERRRRGRQRRSRLLALGRPPLLHPGHGQRGEGVVGHDIVVGHAEERRARARPGRRCGPCRRRSGTPPGRSRRRRGCRRPRPAGPSPTTSISMYRSSRNVWPTHRSGAISRAGPRSRRSAAGGGSRRGRTSSGKRPRSSSSFSVRRSMTVHSPSRRRISRSGSVRRCEAVGPEQGAPRVRRPSRRDIHPGHGS